MAGVKAPFQARVLAAFALAGGLLGVVGFASWRSTRELVGAAAAEQEGQAALTRLAAVQAVLAARRDGGFESARAQVAVIEPAMAGVPIVAVTSYAMVGDREKALAAGCTGYIEKPINPDTFVAEVRRHLRPAGGGGAS
jgi:CheY-like chemotaxis protein